MISVAVKEICSGIKAKKELFINIDSSNSLIKRYDNEESTKKSAGNTRPRLNTRIRRILRKKFQRAFRRLS